MRAENHTEARRRIYPLRLLVQGLVLMLLEVEAPSVPPTRYNASRTKHAEVEWEVVVSLDCVERTCAAAALCAMLCVVKSKHSHVHKAGVRRSHVPCALLLVLTRSSDTPLCGATLSIYLYLFRAWS
eukprot:2456032-Prymnesium_polylepis.2